MSPKTILETIMEKTSRPSPDDCWPWTGDRHSRGYGVIHRTIAGVSKKTLAHRASWEAHVGPIPDGLCVLHRCNNPPCVNPEHLYIGTHSDNMRDLAETGRLKGEGNPRAKLTNRMVMEIRCSQKPHVELAKKYGVYVGHISGIKTGRLWPHLPVI